MENKMEEVAKLLDLELEEEFRENDYPCKFKISKDGLISSWFVDGRLSKYPSSVGVWNLKQDYN